MRVTRARVTKQEYQGQTPKAIDTLFTAWHGAGDRAAARVAGGAEAAWLHPIFRGASLRRLGAKLHERWWFGPILSERGESG